jgi:hypothetical protein
MSKEVNHTSEILKLSLPLIGLFAISFLGFSDLIKQQAREQQNGICPVCNKKLCNHTEGHHKLPRSLGGNDSLANCVIVDGDVKGYRDCHEILDRNAIVNKLIFLDIDHPEVPIEQVPDSLKKPGIMNKQLKHKQSKHRRFRR